MAQQMGKRPYFKITDAEAERMKREILAGLQDAPAGVIKEVYDAAQKIIKGSRGAKITKGV
jgi:hypothetical protein